MQVQLDAKTVSLQLGNQGVDVRITDNRGRQVGTLRIGHATVEWRKGKLGPSTGRKLELEQVHQRAPGRAWGGHAIGGPHRRGRAQAPGAPGQGVHGACDRGAAQAPGCDQAVGWPRGHHPAQAAGDPWPAS